MEDIDRKFKIRATCIHGTEFTEADGVFFKAGDAAFNQNVIDAYKMECFRLGADPRQMESVDLMAKRVQRYKDLHPALVKVPDVDKGDEAAFVLRPNE